MTFKGEPASATSGVLQVSDQKSLEKKKNKDTQWSGVGGDRPSRCNMSVCVEGVEGLRLSKGR